MAFDSGWFIAITVLAFVILCISVTYVCFNYLKRKGISAEELGWKNSIAVGLVVFIICCYIIIYLIFDESLELQDGIGFILRFATIIMGGVAFVIAFLNFRRKSGDELYFNTKYNNDAVPPYISEVTIHNAKDKSIAIFAVDFIVKGTDERIRLFQKSQPIIIAAYSSHVLKFDSTDKYTNAYVPVEFDEDNIECLCVTFNGSKEAKLVPMRELSDSFRGECIFPLFISDRPADYPHSSVPTGATHWLDIIETDFINDGYESYISVPEHHYLTGYFANNIFYIIPEPEVDDKVGNWLHKKSKKHIYDMEKSTQVDYENGYYNQVPDFGLMSIEEINFREN